MTKYALKDIGPNPFRHVDRYPINREKVEALRESLRATGFWDNLVARASDGGKAEIAYGHHRLTALKEEYGPDHEVDLTVKELSNEKMIQMMARENMEEWGTSILVDHETVRAIVEAYAEGKITLPEVPKKTKTSQIRHAPSYKMGEDDPRARGNHPYTAQTLADFIGWVKPDGAAQDKAHDTLAALQFIEDKVLVKSNFDGLTTKQAGAVVRETRKERKRQQLAGQFQREQAEQEANQAAMAGERIKTAEQNARHGNGDQPDDATQGARVAGSERRGNPPRPFTDPGLGVRSTPVQRVYSLSSGIRKTLAEMNRADLDDLIKQGRDEIADAETKRRGAEKRRKTAERKAQEHEDAAWNSAGEVGATVSKKLKEGKIGIRQATGVAYEVHKGRGKVPPPMEDVVDRIVFALQRKFMVEFDPLAGRISDVIRNRKHLDDTMREELAENLRAVSERCLKYADKIAPKAKPMKTVKAAAKAGGEVVYLPNAKPRKRTRAKGKGAA